MKKETWKQIEDSFYDVSSSGLVRNTALNITRKQYANAEGYFSVTLKLNGIYKGFRVHRLVAMAFIPNPHNYPYVNHKDGNKRNNHVSNLEWCNQSMNVHHAISTGLNNYKRIGNSNGNAKLNDDDVKIIRSLGGTMSGATLAKRFNVSESTISRILKSELWSHL